MSPHRAPPTTLRSGYRGNPDKDVASLVLLTGASALAQTELEYQLRWPDAASTGDAGRNRSGGSELEPQSERPKTGGKTRGGLVSRRLTDLAPLVFPSEFEVVLECLYFIPHWGQ